MARHCEICGRKLGFMDGKVVISNGTVCSSCWVSAGMDLGVKCMMTANRRTVAELESLIDIGVARRKVDVPAKKQQSSPGQRKPFDFIVTANRNRGVTFVCEGRPTINFNDIIHGNEMIIGDGYVRNDSGAALPEIRIICEFDPPIIDPGQIYYEAGTFAPGANGRFDIDDPPVNLEKYAEITSSKTGSAKFTLFFGEQQMQSQECVMDIEAAPAEEMEKLINAMTYEREKNAPGPVNIFLYARSSGSYDLDLMKNPQLLYSMYSNGQEQLIGDAFVSNETGRTLKKVRVDVKFTSDILAPVSVLLGDVMPGQRVDFEVDDPGIDVEKLETLTEIETCTATYSMSVNGKTVAETTGKITICPYNQWNAALILLPAYMTPNHPDVTEVLQNASKWMLVNGMNPSLEGYQGDSRRVEEMVKGVYNAVKEANIFYSNPPASFFGPQRIRLCGSVFEQKFATCMDMTILFASCLESFGLHPVLITAPGHIFAGVWLSGSGRLQEPIISDAKMIQRFISSGQLIALECTAMTAGNDVDYEGAKKKSNEVIKAIVDNNISDHECIDVQLVRSMGVRPLPIRVPHASPAQNVKRAEAPELERQTADPEPREKQKPAVAQVPRHETVSAASPSVSTEQAPAEKPCRDGDAAYRIEEYRTFTGDLSHISADNFYDRESRGIIKDAIAEIVEIEGPISQPALIRTIISATSLGRASRQISEHLDKLVAGANVKITRQNGVRFLWPQGSIPEEYMIYRKQNQRDPDNICKYEMKNAVCCLIQENGPVTKAQLEKGLVSLFGYSRAGSKVEDGAAKAVKEARSLKAIEQDSTRRFVLAGSGAGTGEQGQ